MLLSFSSKLAVTTGHLAPALLDAAIRSAVLLAMAGGVVLLMRRASAAARHWVWLLALGGLLVLPALSATLPGWNILPLAPGHGSPLPGVAAMSVTLTASSVVPSAVSAPDEIQAERPIAGARAEAAPSSRQENIAATVAAPSMQAVPAAAAKATADLAPSFRFPDVPWTVCLVLVWVAGAVLLLGHVALGYLSLWMLRRQCERVREGEWSELLEQLCQMLEIGRKVELLRTPRRTMPMTWGLWRTRLLLPDEASEWTPQQRRAVLLHELGHVKRWDCAAQLLAQIACALYWFNPVVWVAWNSMQLEREQACDDLVLNTGARASTYAEHLLQSATALPVRRFAGATAAMARPSTLEERLRAILDPRRNRRGMTMKSLLATILLLTAILVPVAMLRAQENAGADARGPAPAASAAVSAGGAGSSAATRPAPARAGARMGGMSGRGSGFGGMAPGDTTLGEGPTCTLDATIYDVRMPADKIGQLDMEALTKASGSAAEFEKALAALGTAQPLYRANQSVRLAGDNITIGSQTPMITGSQLNGGGRPTNTISYQSTGAIFSLAGKADGVAAMQVDMSVQVSAISEGTTTINDTVKASIIRTAKLSHKGPVEAKKPLVIMSIDAASTDAEGKAVAYIARITLGPPQ